MAEVTSQPTSIQARIAALNLSQVGRAPDTNPSSRSVSIQGTHPSPPLPLNRPSLEHRRKTAGGPLEANGSSTRGNEPLGPESNDILPPPVIQRTGQKVPQQTKPKPPSLPARRPSAQSSPAFPSRRSSEQPNRRGSVESVSSVASGVSSISALSIGPVTTSTSRSTSIDGGRIKAPAYDPTTLPPLPPKRPQQDKDRIRIPLKATKTSPIVASTEIIPPRTPSLPPRLPTRKEPIWNGRKLPPETLISVPKRSALSFGLNKETENPSPTTNGVQSKPPVVQSSGVGKIPPPVPLASRPDLYKRSTAKPQRSPAPSVASCLKCRDFSAPDHHATLFPRQSVPSLDWLASQLTSPFSSLTDKARAIFTWLHHNIDYDVVSFFNNAIKPSTPSSTLSTGLAVCEGYANLFTTLATKAGLESMVVSGHGMGFATAQVAAGSAFPPQSMNHAWNVIKIDHGEWKLIDSCWGAGHIAGKGQPYTRFFNSSFFTMDNDEFGLRHYPENNDHFFRIDGRPSISWEEYIMADPGGEKLQVYGAAKEHFLKETSFLPKYKTISVDPRKYQSPTIRFQFEKICEHFDFERNGNGKPYLFVLIINNQNGKGKVDRIPFESNGQFWWLDIRPELLGVPGQSLMIGNVATLNGRDVRGLTKQEYLSKKDIVSSTFGGICTWDLV